MMTDTEIKLKGMKAILASLGEVGAERFVALIQREPFDYTKWQRGLWTEMPAAELRGHAMKFRKENKKE